MLRMPRFEYQAASSADEAVALYAAQRDTPGGVQFVAGGTDLYPNMKRRVQTPRVVIGLRAIPGFRDVREQANGSLKLGAGTPLAALAADPLLQERYPAVAAAAGLVSTPQLRTMGTLGGNLCLDTRCNYYDQSLFWRKAEGFCLKKDGNVCPVAPGGTRCWAVHSSDTVPALVAYDASVTIFGPNGTRTEPLVNLYRDDGIDYLTLQPGELVTEVALPPKPGWRGVYLKLRDRESFDFPIAGVAATLERAADGAVRDARLVLGAVASYPLRVEAAEALLRGQPLTPETIKAAAEAAYQAAHPMDNTGGTIAQRRRTVRVFVARALRTLAA